MSQKFKVCIKSTENRNPCKNMCTNAQNSIHNSQKIEIIQMAII